MREETFGPLIGIMKVTSDKEAISLMNDSEFGLTASLWSSNRDGKVDELADLLDAGTVFVNRYDPPPFRPFFLFFLFLVFFFVFTHLLINHFHLSVLDFYPFLSPFDPFHVPLLLSQMFPMVYIGFESGESGIPV